MSSKTPRESVTTPIGAAFFSALTRPDEKYKRLKCDLIYDPDDPALEALRERMQAFGEQHFDTLVPAKAQAYEIPVEITLPIRDHTDKEGKSTGDLMLRTGCKGYWPSGERKFLNFVDCAMPQPNTIESPNEPGNGSKLRIGCSMVANYIARPDQDVKKYGGPLGNYYVTLYPQVVQIVEHVAGGGQTASDFDMGGIEGGFQVAKPAEGELEKPSGADY